MKFFFPDAQDFIDPGFNFTREEYSPGRIRQRDDRYAHEVFPTSPYDGLLVSKAIVDGGGGDKDKKYSDPQRHRLLRLGAHEFFRTDLPIMGDCGAFSYVAEDVPPVTVDEVIDFYEACRFNIGVSVDHMILAYKPELDVQLSGIDGVPEDWRRRQEVTLALAEKFLERHAQRGCMFSPMAAAQGWSPKSYASCVARLQEMGYRRIGLGGMVPLKTPEVLACLDAIAEVRRPETELHLFGVTRCEAAPQFHGLGVASFDSTSPLKQAFMDDRDNYYTPTRTYVAVRIPQVEKNRKLKKAISSGEIDQGEAVRLERACLEAVSGYGSGEVTLEAALEVLGEYERLHDGKIVRTEAYRETLGDRPWEHCGCEVCQEVGVETVVFRGAERNRRRAFHNLWVTRQKLDTALGEKT